MNNSGLSRFSVVIADASILTPLDSPREETWSALLAGKMVTDRGDIDSALMDEPAEMDRAARLAIRVAKRVSGIEKSTPLFVGTSKGPILSQLAAIEALRSGRLTRELAENVAMGPAAIACEVARALGLRGMLHTSVAACSSGLHAFHRAVRAIEFGEVERALVVAADASHHELFEGSFERLGVLAKPDDDGKRRCRPFDPSGGGFIVSEAAAAILLERATAGDRRVRVGKSCLAGDSTGLIAVDSRGESLRETLRQVRGDARIKFVHGHGTGTAHDDFELAAIRDICGATTVTSSKKWLGHSLGAAGLVALVLSERSHREGKLWNGQEYWPGESSITISQGFGGHIAAVVLES